MSNTISNNPEFESFEPKLCVQDNIPQTKQQRNNLQKAVGSYIEKEQLQPVISVDDLVLHSTNIAKITKQPEKYLKFIAVLINNELWRSKFASIPNNRRLLLLPKCLRDQKRCPADIDELGLLCKHCHSCIIDDLQTIAEKLGYVVLVAEGSPVVISLIEAGKIDGVLGISCMSVLEEVFPLMNLAGVPGLAVPLLREGCVDTHLDFDWAWDAIHLTSNSQDESIDLVGLRQKVDTWFTSDELRKVLGKGTSQTEQIAYHWLSKFGKRWRPFLTAGVFEALQSPSNDESIEINLRRIAVATECFHKASLVHDDIEDDDSLRYGEKTLHEEYGIPIALNVGDLLLGEGYRLITQCQVSAKQKARMLAVAAQGHRDLCLGQGAELYWLRHPEPLSPKKVLEIFAYKTAPAFHVALHLGAIFAGASEKPFYNALTQYCESLGIAYQIRDDLHDFLGNDDPADIEALRPSLLLALAYEKATGSDKELLELIWRRNIQIKDRLGETTEIIKRLNIEVSAAELLESYKYKAISSLSNINDENLKTLLRRVLAKIFA